MKAHEAHQQLVDAIGLSKKNYLQTAKLLSQLKNEYQLAVGEGIDTWQDYVTQPEIGMTVGEANRLIQIYDVFIEKMGYPEEYIASIPLKNLHYLLPLAKKGEDTGQLMEDASVLSQKDFRERVYEFKNDTDERTYSYMIMRKCDQTGSLNKIHGIESDKIKEDYGLE